ncbi:hypothetical protein [Circoviridae 21 LDMD-2013]|uniref:hypothetical protein n=1 Tax=Circoviridae 21 LDMD-2013 TaxID=1379725 RepID=UPI0003846A09|nr:hypothetical protein [Circoviridae 21 LDMD-2013]AGS36242.1 hypothetical protein [Circoviridae 21 LDMD-2013]
MWKRPVSLRFLNELTSVAVKMSLTAAAAPLHCLSRYMMIRTLSDVSPGVVVAGRIKCPCTKMCFTVIFLPILVDCVVPSGISSNELFSTVPAAATVVPVLSVSKNFISPGLPLNLP